MLLGHRVIQVACGSRDAQTLALTDEGRNILFQKISSPREYHDHCLTCSLVFVRFGVFLGWWWFWKTGPRRKWRLQHSSEHWKTERPRCLSDWMWCAVFIGTDQIRSGVDMVCYICQKILTKQLLSCIYCYLTVLTPLCLIYVLRLLDWQVLKASSDVFNCSNTVL